MAQLLNRGLSLLIVVVVVSLIAFEKGGAAAAKAALNLLLPLACIWYGEAIGGFTGFARGQRVDTPTPGLLITGLDWLMLVGLPIVVHLLTVD